MQPPWLNMQRMLLKPTCRGNGGKCLLAEGLIRRQHARIEELEDVADMAIKRIAELEAQLSAIGAGGVEPLRPSCSISNAPPNQTKQENSHD